MILQWMIYATVISACAAIAATAGDRLAMIWKLPRRFIWAGALAVSVGLPAAAVFRPAAPAASSADVVVRYRVGAALGGPVANAAPSTPAAPAAFRRDVPPYVESLAGAGWIGASLLLLALLLRDMRRVRARRAAWKSHSLGGQTLLVSDDVGPAVIGAVRPVIVLPEWALALDARERELMLRHEAEHISAGDPRLLFIAALLLVLFPWNAALWLMVQRLRLAVEIDCDARVLRASAHPREYGLLLIAVSARHNLALPMAVSLAERRPLLERRILAMTTLRPSRPLLASMPFALLVLAAAVGAAQTPVPPPVAPASAPAPARAPSAAVPAVPSRAPVPAMAAEAPLTPAAAPAAESRAERADAERAMVLAKLEAARASGEPRLGPIPVDTLTVWIALHHPEILRGASAADRVVIVVDEHDHYVASVADATENTAVGQVIKDAVGKRDIENVEVLKGAGAAATYGAGAEKGVIIVKTRQGEPGFVGDTLVIAKEIAARATAMQADPIIIVDGQVMPRRVVEPGAFAKLKVDPKDIDAVDVLKFAPGKLAPNALAVVVVKLKG